MFLAEMKKVSVSDTLKVALILAFRTYLSIGNFKCGVKYETMLTPVLLLFSIYQNESSRNEIANKLAFSSDEDAFKRYVTPSNSETMKDQLRISKNQLRHANHGHYDTAPLPSTMPQALEEHRQAIVVTEATPPFQIVHVNDVWTGLCGWSMDECRGKTLSLLQGRETELSAVTSLMNQLLRGEEGGVVLTNYTKEGRRFRNHLRVAPCDGLFVGVLQEIHDEN
jgi:PAS domain-containing protein